MAAKKRICLQLRLIECMANEIFLAIRKILDARRHKLTFQGTRLEAKGKKCFSDDLSMKERWKAYNFVYRIQVKV